MNKWILVIVGVIGLIVLFILPRTFPFEEEIIIDIDTHRELYPVSFYSTTSRSITTDTVVPIDNTVVSDSNYTLLNDQITILSSGIYQLSYSITYDITSTAGSTRGKTMAWVELNSGIVLQSYSAVYHREASGGSGQSATFIFEVSADDVIELIITRDTYTTALDTENVNVSIIKIDEIEE